MTDTAPVLFDTEEAKQLAKLGQTLTSYQPGEMVYPRANLRLPFTPRTYRAGTFHRELDAIRYPERYVAAIHFPPEAVMDMGEIQINKLIACFPQNSTAAGLPYFCGITIPLYDPKANSPCVAEKAITYGIDGIKGAGFLTLATSVIVSLGGMIATAIHPAWGAAAREITHATILPTLAGVTASNAGRGAAVVWAQIRRLIGSNDKTIHTAFVKAATDMAAREREVKMPPPLIYKRKTPLQKFVDLLTY